MFAEDLTVFFNTAEFAVTATYKQLGIGAGVAVKVIFDSPGIDQLGITGTNPTVLAIASDFAGFTNTDTLTLGANVYRIIQDVLQSDGAITELQLEKQ